MYLPDTLSRYYLAAFVRCFNRKRWIIAFWWLIQSLTLGIRLIFQFDFIWIFRGQSFQVLYHAPKLMEMYTCMLRFCHFSKPSLNLGFNLKLSKASMVLRHQLIAWTAGQCIGHRDFHRWNCADRTHKTWACTFFLLQSNRVNLLLSGSQPIFWWVIVHNMRCARCVQCVDSDSEKPWKHTHTKSPITYSHRQSSRISESMTNNRH